MQHAYCKIKANGMYLCAKVQTRLPKHTGLPCAGGCVSAINSFDELMHVDNRAVVCQPTTNLKTAAADHGLRFSAAIDRVIADQQNRSLSMKNGGRPSCGSRQRQWKSCGQLQRQSRTLSLQKQHPSALSLEIDWLMLQSAPPPTHNFNDLLIVLTTYIICYPFSR